MPKRVLIVEDHALVALSLPLALSARGWIVETTDGPTAADIIEHAHRFGPRSVLLDIRLGDAVGCGIDLIAPVARHGRRGRDAHRRDRPRPCWRRASRPAPPAWIGKHASLDEVEAALGDVRDGRPLIGCAVREAMIEELRTHRATQRSALSPFEQLTQREREVLALLIDGLSAEEIAETRYVALTTVRSQIRSVLRKLGVRSQLAAVARARRAGWTLRDDRSPSPEAQGRRRRPAHGADRGSRIAPRRFADRLKGRRYCRSRAGLVHLYPFLALCVPGCASGVGITSGELRQRHGDGSGLGDRESFVGTSRRVVPADCSGGRTASAAHRTNIYVRCERADAHRSRPAPTAASWLRRTCAMPSGIGVRGRASSSARTSERKARARGCSSVAAVDGEHDRWALLADPAQLGDDRADGGQSPRRHELGDSGSRLDSSSTAWPTRPSVAPRRRRTGSRGSSRAARRSSAGRSSSEASTRREISPCGLARFWPGP